MSHNLELLSFQKMYGLLGFIRKIKALQRSARGRSWRVADTLRFLQEQTNPLSFLSHRMQQTSGFARWKNFRLSTVVYFTLWPPLHWIWKNLQYGSWVCTFEQFLSLVFTIQNEFWQHFHWNRLESTNLYQWCCNSRIQGHKCLLRETV